MPPIIIAFFIAVGLTTVPPVLKALVTPRDPAMRSKLGKPAPVGYHTWTSCPWVAVSARDTRSCDVTYFALTTRRRPARLLVGGVEQLVDTSWSFERRLSEGERRTLAFEFRDPVGGALLACQEQTVTCYSEFAPVLDFRDVREGQCRQGVAPKSKAGVAARLTGKAPPFSMPDPSIGGAYVDVSFEIIGQVTEDWYCPRIVVEWPDQTVSTRESDCPPFEQRDPDQRFRWRFSHGFPVGESTVRACVYKAGRLLTCETVIVRVIGGTSEEN